MKRWIVGLGVAVMAWMNVESVEAQTPPETLPAMATNGCGSGRLGFLVPNRTKFTGCQFKQSCDTHDKCYSRCEKGGDLFENPICNDRPSTKQRQQICDAALQTNINAANEGRPVCKVYASAYRVAVQIMGASFFNGIAGTEPVGLIQIEKLLAYLEEHPDDFDPVDLEESFTTIADIGVNDASYEFWLLTGGTAPPSLVIRHKDKELFKINGRKDSK